VTNAGFCHDRDRAHGLNSLDHLRVAHSGDSTVNANVSGNPLECHDRYGACVLGNLCLLSVDDVHNDAAFQHLGQPALDELSAR